MNTIAKTTNKINTKVLLSTLWIVVMINMLKADILSLYIPGTFEEVARTAGDTPVAQLMLGGAIMMEISIVMIILSRVLAYRVNRWINILASVVTIVFVVGGGETYPPLHIHRNGRSCVFAADYLVCMEVERTGSIISVPRIPVPWWIKVHQGMAETRRNI